MGATAGLSSSAPETSQSPAWAAPISAARAARDDWPMFRADAAGTATVGVQVPRKAQPQWRQRVPACDLTAPIGLSQPTVSHHLRILTESGLLEREKRGVWAYYRLVPSAIQAIADLLTPPRKRATKKAAR